MERKHSRNIGSMMGRKTAERERETGRERKKKNNEAELNFYLINTKYGDSAGPADGDTWYLERRQYYIAACVLTCYPKSPDKHRVVSLLLPELAPTNCERPLSSFP
jgi:hypothetical protein